MHYGNSVSHRLLFWVACPGKEWSESEGWQRHPKLGLVTATLAPATALCIPKWAVPGNAVFKITLVC